MMPSASFFFLCLCKILLISDIPSGVSRVMTTFVLSSVFCVDGITRFIPISFLLISITSHSFDSFTSRRTFNIDYSRQNQKERQRKWDTKTRFEIETEMKYKGDGDVRPGQVNYKIVVEQVLCEWQEGGKAWTSEPATSRADGVAGREWYISGRGVSKYWWKALIQHDHPELWRKKSKELYGRRNCERGITLTLVPTSIVGNGTSIR